MTANRLKRRMQLRLGGWMYIFVAGFIGLAAINSQTNLLFWTFGLMVGGLIVSTFYCWLMMTAVSITRLLPDHGASGEPMQIRYVVRNHKWFVPCFGMVIKELNGDEYHRLSGKPRGLLMFIPPRATANAEAIGWPTRRGPIMFDQIEVGATFPFGIVRFYNVYTQPAKVLIYPRMYRVHRQLLRELRTQDISGARTSQQGGGNEEFYGLREYRPGDSVRLIDWKHTARMQKLVCREMARMNPPKLMLLLDVRDRGEYPFDDAEKAISFAASVLCEAHLDGYEVGMAIVGAGCPTFQPGHGRWHRVRLLHAMAETNLMVEDDMPLSDHINRESFWLVVHSGEVDESLGPRSAMHLGADQFPHWRLFRTEAEQLKETADLANATHDVPRIGDDDTTPDQDTTADAPDTADEEEAATA